MVNKGTNTLKTYMHNWDNGTDVHANVMIDWSVSYRVGQYLACIHATEFCRKISRATLEHFALTKTVLAYCSIRLKALAVSKVGHPD